MSVEHTNDMFLVEEMRNFLATVQDKIDQNVLYNGPFGGVENIEDFGTQCGSLRLKNLFLSQTGRMSIEIKVLDFTHRFYIDGGHNGDPYFFGLSPTTEDEHSDWFREVNDRVERLPISQEACIEIQKIVEAVYGKENCIFE